MVRERWVRIRCTFACTGSSAWVVASFNASSTALRMMYPDLCRIVSSSSGSISMLAVRGYPGCAFEIARSKFSRSSAANHLICCATYQVEPQGALLMIRVSEIRLPRSDISNTGFPIWYLLTKASVRPPPVASRSQKGLGKTHSIPASSKELSSSLRRLEGHQPGSSVPGHRSAPEAR
jgi:hypothetical protein